MDLNYQYAHHTHEESETVRGVTLRQAREAFDKFDWAGEAAKANELQKCAPTLSIIVDPGKEFIWVSSYGEPEKPEFVSNCCFPGEVSAWFGLSKKVGVVDLDHSSFTVDQARKAINLFLDKSYDKLRTHY